MIQHWTEMTWYKYEVWVVGNSVCKWQELLFNAFGYFKAVRKIQLWYADARQKRKQNKQHFRCHSSIKLMTQQVIPEYTQQNFTSTIHTCSKMVNSYTSTMTKKAKTYLTNARDEPRILLPHTHAWAYTHILAGLTATSDIRQNANQRLHWKVNWLWKAEHVHHLTK